MGTWSDRIHLMVEGWSTDVRASGSGYSDPDKVGIGIWAKTWRWQNRVAEVTLHAHGSFLRSNGDPAPVLERISARLLEACIRARHEFTDCVPCMADPMEDGRIGLVRSSWETEHFLKGKEAEFPNDILNVVPGLPESGYYRNSLKAAMTIDGADYSDHLLPYAEPRYSRDENPREWDFTVRHQLRRIDGQIVKSPNFKYGEITTRAIDEDTVAGLVDVSTQSVIRRIADHGPGGRFEGTTDTGLPPGYTVFRSNLSSDVDRDPDPEP